MRLCEEKVKSGGSLGEFRKIRGNRRPLGHDLFAIVRIRFAIRTCNTDSGPSPWPSPEGEGMVRASSKPDCQTKSEAHICPLLPLLITNKRRRAGDEGEVTISHIM